MFVSPRYLSRKHFKQAAEKASQALQNARQQLVALSPQAVANMSLEQIAGVFGINLENFLDFPRGKAIVNAIRKKVWSIKNSNKNKHPQGVTDK